ncbi:oligosaccharide flippase family protein [Bradyrhizobium sp. INPA01-394B]|uniref:Oligosaccharide flippase family protein n=1 Tax=Bradyrhizobium campsiandrae TaxID=1729892 RepID=A0ABR7UG41_9BRAD|nr:oligosaccharide flippase family protein [Bradyrhizobium campsiandrae]MBC9879031.1 oligosaccharide flippase family protein [Bradyrhizobium campsiandrae]MBC9982863.1 oligosaccharide flippase family protein [Bradyrhizobium campsiandrae]
MLNRHFSIYLVAYILPAAVGFFAVTAYTRLLTPAEYGLYVVGISIAGILGAIFFAWIKLSVSRYQAMSAEVDFRGTAMVAFALTVVAMCAATPLVFLFRSDVSVGLVLASMFVAIMSNAVDVGQEFERAKLRPYRFAAISIVRSVSSVGFGLLGIWLGWGGMGLLAAFGLGSLAGIILNLVGDRTRIAGFSRRQFMQLARYGLPLTLAGLSVAIYSASDRLIVAWLLGKDAAGIFGVAADLPRQFMVMIASSVAAATVPLVFRSLAENNETTRERLNESLELLLVVVAPVAVWLALAADQVAGTLVGVDFRAGVSALLPTLVLARFFGIANQFYVQISFQLAERPFMLAAQSFLTLVVSVALMFALVGAYGIYGAALATFATEAIGFAVAVALMHRAHPVPFDIIRLVGVAASAAAMAGAILIARSQISGTGIVALIGVSIAGGVAYVAAAWLLNVANVRTLSLRFLRTFNRKALGV